MLGIVVAMAEELKPLMRVIKKIKDKSVDGIELFDARINNVECIIGISGVGKVAAASCTRLLIDKGADHIVNIGSAGVAKEDLCVGDIVVSSESVQTDIDLSQLDSRYKKGQPFASNKIFYEASPNLIKIATKAALNIGLKASIGKIGTQDHFMNSPEETKIIHTDFGVIAKDMESGAVAHVCHKKGIPYISLKILSDKPKDEKDLQFYDNLVMALDKGSAYLYSFAKEYLIEYNNKSIKTTIKEDFSKKAVVGIIAATEEDRNAVIEKINRPKFVSKSGDLYVEGLIDFTPCVLATSGIGKVNVADCTRGLLDNYNIDTIILSGTAGAVKSTLKIGDVVIAKKSVQADFDVTDLNLKEGNHYRKGQLYEASEQFFKVTSDLDELTQQFIKDSKIFQGTVVTKDKYGSECSDLDWIAKEFNAICVDTEGAAVAQICQRAKKKYIIIKGISKTSENVSTRSNPFNERLATKNAANMVKKFILGKERKIVTEHKIRQEYVI